MIKFGNCDSVTRTMYIKKAMHFCRTLKVLLKNLQKQKQRTAE